MSSGRPSLAALIALPIALCLVETAATAGPAVDWRIGPVVRGENSSRGMPLHPEAWKEGWRFTFPGPTREDGHVHYVTREAEPLNHARELVVRYRIHAAPGTRFAPQERPGKPATVSLYLQRSGDDWTAEGDYEFYRWFAPAETVRQLEAGLFEVRVALDDPRWISVLGKPAEDHPDAFDSALREADRLGLLFGSAGARGHGVYTTGPARFTLLEFSVR
ncbi:hypothetical protein B5C34_15020 [Pacificimonas flava]|uniref:Uncharacterized protein n=2 Tax=Pacificimonas TaxID=1960290 RepID=A0A219B1X0_9SPHN|nr:MULTISPECIES: hypothetical protein [Pacificimonas]MBZ6379725.1 hypothetical protein [Pacificimonas aurantium]OWV31818.1 hypothetical protein B5C34_15020 [Pacificimonas flava]